MTWETSFAPNNSVAITGWFRDTCTVRLGGAPPPPVTDQLVLAGGAPGALGAATWGPLASSTSVPVRATRSTDSVQSLVLLQGVGQNSVGRFSVLGFYNLESSECVFWKKYERFNEAIPPAAGIPVDAAPPSNETASDGPASSGSAPQDRTLATPSTPPEAAAAAAAAAESTSATPVSDAFVSATAGIPVDAAPPSNETASDGPASSGSVPHVRSLATPSTPPEAATVAAAAAAAAAAESASATSVSDAFVSATTGDTRTVAHGGADQAVSDVHVADEDAAGGGAGGIAHAGDKRRRQEEPAAEDRPKDAKSVQDVLAEIAAAEAGHASMMKELTAELAQKRARELQAAQDELQRTTAAEQAAIAAVVQAADENKAAVAAAQHAAGAAKAAAAAAALAVDASKKAKQRQQIAEAVLIGAQQDNSVAAARVKELSRATDSGFC
jgi:hypothetical protein